MFDGLTLVVALGLFMFLFAYIAFKLDASKHSFFQLLIIGFLAFMATQLPRAAIEYGDDCGLVVANETVLGNVTSFDYVTVCDERGSTDETFLKASLWFVRVWVAWVLIYILWSFGQFVVGFWKGRGGRR